MKVRRRMVEERYRLEIDNLYSEEPVPAAEATG
jgi:hypothetical protein